VTEVTKMLSAGITRRDALRRGAGVAAGSGVATFLAACGSQGGQSTVNAAAPSLAKPGLDIPITHVDFSMAPFADDTVPVIAMKEGYFADNGIQIGPTPTGAKLALTADIAPILTNQVQAGSMVFEVLLSKLDNVTNVTAFLIHSSFEGYTLFAPKGSTAKPVGYFLGKGLSFPAAVEATMKQFKGKNLSFSNDPAAQLFYELIFSLGGLKESDFDVTRLADSNIVSLALAGRTALAAPSGGPQVEQLAGAGLTQILTEQQLLRASTDPRRLGLVGHSAFVVREDFLQDNYEAVLRLAASIFHADDLIVNHPAQAAAVQLPFLNSYAGTNITLKELEFLHGPISEERTFDQMGIFFTEPEPFNIFTSGAVAIEALRQQKVLTKPHTVSQALVAPQVWNDLRNYRARADVLFRTHATGNRQVVARARKLYDGRNYLDAYRALATLD
jgi:ABC-type nitrate/sulfonate/bicarbonate transport system substrate-binding protein